MNLRCDDKMCSDDGLQEHGRQRWENQLRAENGKNMQSFSSHVRGESLTTSRSASKRSARIRSSQSGVKVCRWDKMGTAEGVVGAHATRPQDVDERRNGDFIKKVQGTSARPRPSRGQQMIPRRVRFDPPPEGVLDPTMQPRKEQARLPTSKRSTTVHARTWRTKPDAVTGGACQSTPNIVMNFMTKVHKKQAEEERFFVHVQDWVGVSG